MIINFMRDIEIEGFSILICKRLLQQKFAE